MTNKPEREVAYENLTNANSHFMTELEEAARSVIRSGWYVLGQQVTNFEDEFAAYTGAKYCVGVGNGLDALTLSIMALQLPSKSDILVASNTYIATILAIVHAGHNPVLVEPDPETFNLDATRLPGALTAKSRAICVTHLFGKSCRMDEISNFAETHNLKIVEDCAQSHGATLNGQMTGTFGEAGCFSFYPTKNLGGVGDGGAVITNDPELADRLIHLRNYGSKQKYVNRYIGVNSRLDELQAALLRVKLRYLNQMTAYKRQLAELYFEGLPEWLTLPRKRLDEFDVFHIYGVRCERRDELKHYLLSKGVKTEIHYPIPPHRQEAMKNILKGNYPIADELHATELSLPISFGHTEDDILYVINQINTFY